MIKRHTLFLMLVVVFIFNGSNLNITAKNIEEKIIVDGGVEGLKDESEYYYNAGLQANKTRASYSYISGMTFYSQIDPRWRNTKINGCNSTIGSVGCALTSTAIVTSKYYNPNKTPAQMNYEIGNNACPMQWSFAANKYGYNLSYLQVRPSDEEYNKVQITGALHNGKPVIVGLTELGTNRTHFVVASGYYRSDSDLKSGTIFILDPGKRYENDSVSLDRDYMDNWYFYRLLVASR